MLVRDNLSNLRQALETFQQCRAPKDRQIAESRVGQILLANTQPLLYLYEHHCRPPELTKAASNGTTFGREVQGYLYRCSLIVSQSDIARSMECSTSYVNNLVNLTLNCKLEVIVRFLTGVRTALGDNAELIVNPDAFVAAIYHTVKDVAATVPVAALAQYSVFKMSEQTITRTLGRIDLMSMGRAKDILTAASLHRDHEKQTRKELLLS